jgi:excisionase family DNA binding protein
MPETQSTNDTPAFMTTTEAAQFLGLQPATLVRYSTEGRVRAAFYGRHWHFQKADLLEFAADNRRGKR